MRAQKARLCYNIFMVIGAILALFFALFFAVRRHMGPGILAVVAGVAVYEAFSAQLLDLSHNLNLGLPDAKVSAIIAFILVVGFPMILYLKSSKGGMFGLIRIVEALIIAALVTSLIAPAVGEWFAFDDLSKQIMGWINSVRGPMMMIGIGSAYLDILLYRG